MSWMENLGIEVNVDSDDDEKDYVFSRKIDTYFKNLGFYEHTMNPRFMNGSDYDELKHGEPVLRFDGDWDSHGEGVQRVFMNKHEVYVERQTNYRSYDGSDYHQFDEPPTSIGEIESVLEQLVRKYEEY